MKNSRHKMTRKAISRFAVFSVISLALSLLGCPPSKPASAGAGVAEEKAIEETEPTASFTEGFPAENSAEEVHPEANNSVAVLASLSLQTAPWPRFVLIPESARPGEPVTIGYSDAFNGPGPWNIQAALLDRRGRRLAKAAFFSLPREPEELELKAAILAIPSTALSGNALIRVESADGIIKDLPFTIDSREFHSETIQLDQANTDLRTVPDPQKTAESERLWAVISRTGTDIYWGEQFLPPVTSTRRTSSYGSRRVYEYSNGKNDTTIHAGVDIGVPTGTEVRACAAGRVVLAKYRIVTGNTVILEHLPGVYSLYYHMNKIDVAEGARCEAGSLLGESGSTGLATGPHLHWEIRVSTENADPDAFLSRPILDKKDILNRMMDGDFE